MSLADLKALVERGDVLPNDRIKCGAEGEWKSAGSMAEFLPSSDLGNRTALAKASAAETPPVETPVAEPLAARSAAAEMAAAEQEPVEPAPAGTAPGAVMPAAGRRGFRFFAAAGVLLALLGGVSGGLSALLWGDAGDSQAIASSAPAVDQQKIAALWVQIEDLERHRQQLEEAANPPASPSPPASAPRSSPETPPAPSLPPAANPPAPPPDMPAAPADGPAPKAESKGSEGDGDGEKALDPLASMRAASPAPGLPAGQPPATSSGPPTAAPLSPPATAGLTPEQVRERQRQRLELLKQIYAERAELLVQHAKLQAELDRVDAAISKAQGQLAAASVGIAELETLIATAQFNPTANGSKIAEWTTGVAELGAATLLIQAQIEQLNVERAGVVEKINAYYAEADQLRSRWLAVVDPFGRLDRGEEESAIAAFSEWVRLQPDAPWAWLARGFAFWQLGKDDAAFTDFNQAVSLKGPAISNSLAARGGLLHAMGRSKDAMADFGKALKLNKADGMVYLFRARCYCADEKYSAARKDFETAIRLSPKDAETYRQYALLQAACPKDRFRNGKKAVANAEQACELTEWKNWSALDTLAAANAEAGRFDEACRWAEKAASLTYGANRGQCLARLKQYQAGQPLRLDWKNQIGNPSAAADSPIAQ